MWLVIYSALSIFLFFLVLNHNISKIVFRKTDDSKQKTSSTRSRQDCVDEILGIRCLNEFVVECIIKYTICVNKWKQTGIN